MYSRPGSNDRSVQWAHWGWELHTKSTIFVHYELDLNAQSWEYRLTVTKLVGISIESNQSYLLFKNFDSITQLLTIEIPLACSIQSK